MRFRESRWWLHRRDVGREIHRRRRGVQLRKGREVREIGGEEKKDEVEKKKKKTKGYEEEEKKRRERGEERKGQEGEDEKKSRTLNRPLARSRP